MDIQEKIREDLFSSIRSTYESGNFTHSIVDAVHFLSDILREKSGLDADGVALISEAFKENEPLIKLNKLETETEKNIQEGIKLILLGLYKSIRNPRSHEQHENMEDTKNDADSIILFINYLSNIIDESKGSFSLDTFLEHVFDKNFVKEKKYAKLLVCKIPKKKRFDTLIEIFRNKGEGDIEAINLVINEIFQDLSRIQKDEFILIISDELSSTNNEEIISYDLRIIPPKYWKDLSEMARLRIENMIINSIRIGEYFRKNEFISGTLATWANQHFEFFDEKLKLAKSFIEKLDSKNQSEQLYVLIFFLCDLPKIITVPWEVDQCIKLISNLIKNGKENIENILITNFNHLPEEWSSKFKVELEGVVNFNNEDDIPF